METNQVSGFGLRTCVKLEENFARKLFNAFLIEIKTKVLNIHVSGLILWVLKTFLLHYYRKTHY